MWKHSTYSLSPIPRDVAESKETYEITLTCLKQRILTTWQKESPRRQLRPPSLLPCSRRLFLVLSIFTFCCITEQKGLLKGRESAATPPSSASRP